jgi:hypothetical protein
VVVHESANLSLGLFKPERIFIDLFIPEIDIPADRWIPWASVEGLHPVSRSKKCKMRPLAFFKTSAHLEKSSSLKNKLYFSKI